MLITQLIVCSVRSVLSYGRILFVQSGYIVYKCYPSYMYGYAFLSLCQVSLTTFGYGLSCAGLFWPYKGISSYLVTLLLSFGVPLGSVFISSSCYRLHSRFLSVSSLRCHAPTFLLAVPPLVTWSLLLPFYMITRCTLVTISGSKVLLAVTRPGSCPVCVEMVFHY